MVWDGKESRKFPSAVCPCKIIIDDSFKKSSSYTENISEEGVKIILDTKLELLSIVGLEIFIEKTNPVFCHGKIVWIEEKVNPSAQGETLYHTGIAFIDITIEHKNYIKKHIKHLLSGEN